MMELIKPVKVGGAYIMYGHFVYVQYVQWTVGGELYVWIG